MSDARLRELLGVPPDASREQIRSCWRRRVMENHPDRFPPERKAPQEMRIIALNEAYATLMALARVPHTLDGRPSAGSAATGEPHGAGGSAAPHAPGAIGPHRDPAYAYYKQGFL